MPFWRAYYHVVWGTKKRRHVITPELERELYPFLVRKSAELGLYVYSINGWTDHVHMIITIPPKNALSDIVGKLKGSSSHYINDHELVGFDFKWQRGYGGLTLGYTQLDTAIRYVERQKEHHAKQSTNKWLERIEDWDDGPQASSQSYSDGIRTIREESPSYGGVVDEMRFP